MANPLQRFALPIQQWFSAVFHAPTPVQQAAWTAIASGKHSLVIAPTGSGKTLAAFLHAIDALFVERSQQREQSALKPAAATKTRILYISPVKALAADVQRNLQLPLAGVVAKCRELAIPEVTITVGMRSGDTPAAERAKLLRHPPDILITTPESLFLMLTSRARETLRSITSVILDEVHAVAGSKRGSQLALSLERLDQLLAEPAQRIGLSATVRPEERLASFLGGSQPATIVHPPSSRALEMRIVVPVEDMTDIPGRPDKSANLENAGSPGSIWPHVEASILDQVLARHSTIVFTNSRGLAEKLTARLNELYAARYSAAPPTAGEAIHYGSFSGGTGKRTEGAAPQIARSHHGSVSKEQRAEIESALKAGELRCVVATSSLELGIDMGLVDLVIQVGAPPSVASALQRVGRAGHQVDGTSCGIVYPRTRRDLVDTTVTVQCMLSGQLEAIEPPRNPLDVLAQQTVAAVAMDALQVDSWFAMVRRADPFRTLPRSAFDATLDMLAGKYPADEFAQFRPRLVWDRTSGILTPRPGAQHLAVTSGGTIPDRGMFSVMLPEGEEQSGSRRVGELDEEMVYESRVNDIITLGATSWRIRQITNDQVVVVPAPGRSARLPFWHGDGPGRSAQLGKLIGVFLREVDELITTRTQQPQGLATAKQQLTAAGLDDNAVHNIVALIDEQREATGVVPNDRTLMIERCRDESGDWRIILHSPYGQRVHAPWALAIAERISRHMGLDPSVVASDDGIIARFPDSEARVPGAELFLFDADQLQRVVADAVSGSALFAARFRECASRALLLPRRNPGKRMPLWQQRLRAGQLLEVAREYTDFPILIETARECLQDVYDLPALYTLMTSLQRGEIQFAEVNTEVPSPFAAPLLFGYVAEFMYASDVPLAERRASLLSLDSNLLGELLGQVDMTELLAPEIVSRVGEELQRTAPGYQATSMEAVADMLRELGPLSLAEIEARYIADEGPALQSLQTLHQARRAIRVTIAGEPRWAAIEDAARLRDALGTSLSPDIPAAFLHPAAHPLRDLISRYARTHTLFTSRQVAQRFGLGIAVASEQLTRLREQNKVISGNFGLVAELPDEASQGAEAVISAGQWVASAVFKRLRVRSLQAAREATRPVSPSAYVTLLLERHGLLAENAGHIATPAATDLAGAYEGLNGVARVIEQLAGVTLPASLWESQILPSRVHDYQPAMLDELLASGEVIWSGHRPLGVSDGLVSLHLSEFADETLPAGAGEPSIAAADWSPLHHAILAVLADGGAWLVRQILPQLAMRLAQQGNSIHRTLVEPEPAEVYRVLWQLAWAGYVTTDTWAAVRAYTGSAAVHRAHPARTSRSRHRRVSSMSAYSTRPAPAAHTMAGRWSLLQREPATAESLALALAENMLDRYGVITRGAAVAEQVPGGFPALQQVLRSLEDAGRILRGRFVDGLGAAQFAENLTIERLRLLATQQARSTPAVAVSAMDPASPFGATLGWPPHAHGARPARRNGALVVIWRGELVIYLPQGGKELLTFAAIDSADWLQPAVNALASALRREKHLRFTLETIDGQPAASSGLITALRAAGFSRVPRGYSWYG
ncbi:ATP-dependent helicase [Pantoea sp. B65]